MATIYVKARPGRRAFHEGRVIPENDYIPVPDTPYIRRLITHWEDIEVQGELPKTRRPTGGGSATAPRPRSAVESPKPATE